MTSSTSYALPGCKTINFILLWVTTFWESYAYLTMSNYHYFIVGYTHADIFQILNLLLFYVRYTWHDMTPTPLIPSKYNEVLLGLSYYDKSKINFSNEYQMIKIASDLCQIGGFPVTLVCQVKLGSDTTEILKDKHPHSITNRYFLFTWNIKYLSRMSPSCAQLYFSSSMTTIK